MVAPSCLLHLDLEIFYGLPGFNFRTALIKLLIWHTKIVSSSKRGKIDFPR
jgi:hypothetical protein